MEFLVSEVPLQNQLFLVFWNFKVMNNKFLIMSVCKHMETLQLGFFPMNSAAVRTFAVDTYFLSVWVCSVFVSFLVTVDVDWTVTAFDSFSADSLPWTEPVKVCAYFIKRNTKKSPNSLLYKTNQTNEQRSCYSKVDTVIKYNFCLVNVRFQWNPAAVQPVCILREELLLVPVSDIRELNVLSSVLLRMSSLCRAAI